MSAQTNNAQNVMPQCEGNKQSIFDAVAKIGEMLTDALTSATGAFVDDPELNKSNDTRLGR